MSTSAESGVQVAWDPNPESNIAGYKLHYGVDGLGLTNVIDVGLSTMGSVSVLAPATAYYFYVNAYNDYDLESDPSTVFYYTSPVEAPVEGPAEVPIILTIEGNLLALAPVQLRLPASLEGGMEASLEINWQQLKGPHFVAIQDPNLIQPAVALSKAGVYSFRVQVHDDLTSDQADVSGKVLAAPSAPPANSQPLKMYPLQMLFDGVAVYRDSVPNATYHIGVKRDLNLPYWILVGADIPSDGDAYTTGLTTPWVCCRRDSTRCLRNVSALSLAQFSDRFQLFQLERIAVGPSLNWTQLVVLRHWFILQILRPSNLEATDSKNLNSHFRNCLERSYFMVEDIRFDAESSSQELHVPNDLRSYSQFQNLRTG